MPEPENARKFWLKPGAVPAGPYTAAEVYARLAAGAVTWDTPARASGEAAWTPLSQVPGIAPAAGPAPDPAALADAPAPAAPPPERPSATVAPPAPVGAAPDPPPPAAPTRPAGDLAGRIIGTVVLVGVVFA